MMNSFKYLLFLSLAILACAARVSNRNSYWSDPHAPKLAITLYYEALCPYCMAFVTTQLFPSMAGNDRLRYADLTLVPYGNANINDEGQITCQHGPDECELNAWHACILEHNNMTISLKLIACMMPTRKNNLDKCAEHYNINVTTVKECKKSRSVDDILRKYGEETDKVNFSGVPAVAVDNVFNPDDQEMLSNYFDEVFCAKYEAKFNIILQNCEKYEYNKYIIV